jgi:hypothetical protein
MKYLLILATLFTLTHAQQAFQLQGQKGLPPRLVTFSTDSVSGKTRILLVGNSVFLDTSATGQTGAWRRIDNTKDSCSLGFNLGSDSLGSARPTWLNKMLGSFRSVDQDSGTHEYRVQTRERLWNNVTYQWYWKDWSRFGANGGYADVTIQDSILIKNSGTTAKVQQYSYFSVDGTQARLCPDDITQTANGAADSIFADSLIYFPR